MSRRKNLGSKACPHVDVKVVSKQVGDRQARLPAELSEKAVSIPFFRITDAGERSFEN